MTPPMRGKKTVGGEQHSSRTERDLCGLPRSDRFPDDLAKFDPVWARKEIHNSVRTGLNLQLVE
jgi:hypothetical protein